MTQVVDTSIIAYKKIMPKLAAKQETVYNAIAHASRCGFDLTDKELSRVLGWEINCVVPRRNELEKLGLIVACCKRKCGVTDEMAYSWKVKL